MQMSIEIENTTDLVLQHQEAILELVSAESAQLRALHRIDLDRWDQVSERVRVARNNLDRIVSLRLNGE
jgi:hypothetical protein